VRVAGRVSGTIRASGPLYGAEGFSLQALRGTAELSQLVVIIGDTQIAATAPLSVQFSPQQVTLNETRFTGPGTNIVMGGTLALGPQGKQEFTANGELNLRLFNGLSPNIFLAGLARIGLRVNGTYTDPRLTGTAQVSGASFSTLLANERLTVSSINGSIRFTSNQAQIESLVGRLGGGRVSVAGGALLDVPPQFRFTVRADDVTVPFPEGFRSTADGELIVQGSTEAQIISGTINLRRAEYRRDIDLADLINRRREPSLTEGGGMFGTATQLDLHIEGRDALIVRNNLADAVGSVALQIRGSLEDPIISGRITATRGTLNFRNDRYDIVRANIDLLPRVSDPLLNIQAETEIRGYRIIVNLNGPLSSGLQANVRSEPSLPQADVVSLITTGNLASDERTLSTLSQTGLGTAASLLTDALINVRAQRATDRLFGLNRFEINPLIAGRSGSTPTARLTVGRQINRNLSVTYSTNLTAEQNQVVIVEYRVSDRLSFIAQYTQGPEANIASSRNNNFSFEIRFRKRF
jgi:translocation and assembly module TamB